MADKGTGRPGGPGVEFTGTWNGKPLEDGFKKTGAKLKGAAQKTGQAMGGMVGENTGRAMSQFNEKTEKGRQLLTAFGGAAGGAAGNIVYYTGTLSYVIGRFSKMELGLMTVIAGLGALAYALLKATPEEIAWKKRTEEHTKRMADMVIKIDEITEANTRQMLGLKSQAQIQEHITREKIKSLEREIKAHRAAQKEMREDASFDETNKRNRRRAALEERLAAEESLYKDLRIAGKAFFKWETDQAALANREAAAEAKAKTADAKERAKVGAPGIEFGFGEDPVAVMVKINTAKEKLENERLAAQQRALQVAGQLEADYYNSSLKMAEENADRRLHILESAANEQIRIEQSKNQVVMNSIAIFDELGSVMAQNEQARTAVKVIAIMAEATYQAAMEVAQGFKELGLSNPWAAAMHFTSAGLFAAVAAGKIAAAAGGGGGGRASVSDRSRGQRGGASDRADEKKEMTIILKLDRRRLGQAVVDTFTEEDARRNPGKPLTEVL